MGIGKWVKKTVGKAINSVTGGNETANKILGAALALPTGGASMSVANQANRDVAAKEQKKADAEEQQRQNAAIASRVAGLNKQAEAYASSVRRSATDVTSMRGLFGDYDQDFGAFDIWNRKRKL